MQTLQADYFAAYRHLKLSRDAKGVLIAEFHNDGGPFIMNAQAHTEFVDAFHRIGQDRANKIVIMTGAGGNFIGDVEWSSFGDVTDPGVWSRIHDEGLEVLENIANIRVPVVAAVEGRAHIHSDYTRSSLTSLWQPRVRHSRMSATLLWDVPPGDGVFTTWSYRAGPGSSRGIPAQSTAAVGARRIRMGSGCRGSAERKGSGPRSRTGRSILAGSGSDAPEYAHSLHSTTERAHRAGRRLRTIARRRVIGRLGKIETMKSRP